MAYDRRTLTGIGGWLAFFILTLAVFGPLRGLVETYANLYGDPSLAAAYGARWPVLQLFEWAVYVAAIAVSLYFAWRLIYVQTRATVRLVRNWLWAAALLPILVEVVGVSLLAGLPLRDLTSGIIGDLARPVIYSAIWTAYLFRSERVANTYTEDDPTAELAAVFE